MKPLLPLAALALFAAADAAVAVEAPATDFQAMPEPGPQDRVLIVSPHPDDDELCCSGYVQRAIARGAQVAIVWMTAGDGFTIDAVLINRHFRESGLGMVQLGRIRISEAVAAARSVGVPLINLRMLGYPDGGLAALLVTHYDQPFRSPHTRRSVVPYGEAPSFNQDMTGRNVEQDLARVIDTFQPTVVFAPHAGDQHPDHSTTGEFVRRALGVRSQLPRLHRYIIHAGSQWPAPRSLQMQMRLDPPPPLRDLPWQRFELTAEEQKAKLAALRWHGTQWEVMAPYMGSFVRTNELFLSE